MDWLTVNGNGGGVTIHESGIGYEVVIDGDFFAGWPYWRAGGVVAGCGGCLACGVRWSG